MSHVKRIDGVDGWVSIDSAPKDGLLVWVYTDSYEELESFESTCAYHPDAGWCTDEIRNVTLWNPEITKLWR